MTLLMGIDPGLSGALCLYHTDGVIAEIIDMPTLLLTRGGKNKRDVDVHSLADYIRGAPVIGHAFVEQVWSMPGQGVSAMFAMGKGYGIVIGVLAACGVPMTLVPAAKWKKALGVPSDKDGARARASQLMPNETAWWPLKKHSDRAEAALIAYWGMRSLDAIRSAA